MLACLMLSLGRDRTVIEATETKAVSTLSLIETLSDTTTCGNSQPYFRALVTRECWVCHLFIYRVFMRQRKSGIIPDG